MALKIGDMLVKAKMITMDQLDEALKQQVMFGGKLGTNLIELGFVDEEALAFILSERLGVPYVHPSKFENIPKEVIAAIPKEVVEKHKVFPVELDGNRLTLVMSDPTDMSVIDDISFLVNMRIKPVIAPEIRLVMAFEKYYGIEKDLRYISLIKNQAQAISVETTNNDMKNVATSMKLEDNDDQDELDFLNFDDDPETEIEGIQVLTLDEEVIKKYSVDEISKDMANANDREEVGEHLLSYVNQQFDTVAIFVVWDKCAVGWKSTGKKSFVEVANRLKLPISEHMPFKRVYDSKSCYLGPCSNSPLKEALGGAGGESELIMPVIMGETVVSFLYVNGNADKLKDVIMDYNGIAVKASLAFEMLILKSKILMT